MTWKSRDSDFLEWKTQFFQFNWSDKENLFFLIALSGYISSPSFMLFFGSFRPWDFLLLTMFWELHTGYFDFLKSYTPNCQIVIVIQWIPLLQLIISDEGQQLLRTFFIEVFSVCAGKQHFVLSIQNLHFIDPKITLTVEFVTWNTIVFTNFSRIEQGALSKILHYHFYRKHTKTENLLNTIVKQYYTERKWLTAEYRYYAWIRKGQTGKIFINTQWLNLFKQ